MLAARVPQGCSCLCLPSTGISCMHYHSQLLMCVLGIELRSSYLQHPLSQLSHLPRPFVLVFKNVHRLLDAGKGGAQPLYLLDEKG